MSSKEQPNLMSSSNTETPPSALRSQTEAATPGSLVEGVALFSGTSSGGRPIALRRGSRGRGSRGYSSSAYTVRSKKSSASEMVKDDLQWSKWKTNQCITEHTARWTNRDFFDLMSTVKFPQCIKSPEVLNHFKEMDYPEFESWALNKPTVQEDPFRLGICAHALASDWKSHANATSRQHMEAGRRKGVDSLIERAFDLQLKGAHQYCMEAHMTLPRSNVHPDPYEAIADAVTIIPISLDYLSDILRVYSWSSLADAFIYHPISFAFEAKLVTLAIRQLILYLVTAQHHRRALGLLDAPVFGATLNSSMFELYVSVWSNNRIEIFPTGYEWNFKRAEEFVSCYLHLCTLAKHIIELHKETFEKSKSGMAEKQMNAADSPWRHDKRPPKEDTNADSESNLGAAKKRKHDSGANERGDKNEMQEEDCDATVVETQFVIDQVVDGKVAPSKPFRLTKVNLWALEDLQEFYNPEPSPTEKIMKWVAEVAASKRKRKRAQDTSETLMHTAPSLKTRVDDVAMSRHRMTLARKAARGPVWVRTKRQRIDNGLDR